ncbi:MAG: RluA family pseudouridine synthase [Verrucomicrobiota bacterium]
MEQFAQIAEAQAGQRLDVFLAGRLERSRVHAQGLIRQGAVRLEPAVARLAPSFRLRPGDIVYWQPPVEPNPTDPPAAPQPEDLPVDILYEDADLLVVNKAPGVVVHPAAGHAAGTLVNALLHHCGGQLAGRAGAERLGIVHRLDKDTSGLMVVAKTNRAHERLGAQFERREVRKEYAALARGTWRQLRVTCREPIARHPVHRQKMAVRAGGRSAQTDFLVERQWPRGRTGVSLLRCQLHTGRTHQIRVHLAYLGHPVLGDSLYARAHQIPGLEKPARQLLHARRLAFTHPASGEELALEAPLPADFTQVIESLDRV